MSQDEMLKLYFEKRKEYETKIRNYLDKWKKEIKKQGLN